MEDDDEFVDAMEGPDVENGEEYEDTEEVVEEDDGFDDDDFGDFAAEEEHEEQEEYDPEEEERVQQEEIQRQKALYAQQSTAFEQPPIVQSLNILANQKFLDFKGKTREQIKREALEYLEQANPSKELAESPTSLDSSGPVERLDNERAMSLWNQLSAPVPLNPPDWKRSRIRRLFLVSLGVPVNLDEILPESGKKKKLVLPSTKPEPPARSLSGKLPPTAPPFDPVSARHKASVSTLALQNMTAEELQDHVTQLKELNSQASENLTYWLARRDEAVGEKESLEGVIESLVGWTERQRKGTTGIAQVPGRGRTPPPQTVKKGKKR